MLDSQDSLISTVTTIGLTSENRGLNPAMGKKFLSIPKRRDWLWAPLKHLFNGHEGTKLYNGQRNAQVFNLFIYLPLPYMFRALF
jgi:hypothetical protein